MGGVAADDGRQETALAEVRAVVRVLDSVGCRYWLGGWGVDALGGRQTRWHRDAMWIDAAYESAVIRALEEVDYRIETDWRPNRVELVGPGGWVDLHPLILEEDGSARQGSLDGGFNVFPASWFSVGSFDGQVVHCFSAAAQRLPYTGDRQRDVDVHDLCLLAALDS